MPDVPLFLGSPDQAADADGQSSREKASDAQVSEGRSLKTGRAASPAGTPFPAALDRAGLNRTWPHDSYASTAIVEIMDRAAHAAMGKATLGLSPSALAAAYLDWFSHLAFSPGKRAQLLHKAQKKITRFSNYAVRCGMTPTENDCAIEPLPQDKRFKDEAWRQWPYNLISQSFLFTQQWWHNATTGVRGVTPQHERVVEFASRQLLDMVAPSNFVWSNPEVLQRTMTTGGANLAQGWRHLLEDFERYVSAKPPVGVEDFIVGE
ncbi:MAG: poly-beta-hydroxybutyrate polymerase N-terminal domain-containing protein, partial [Pseudomonadota bacterium]